MVDFEETNATMHGDDRDDLRIGGLGRVRGSETTDAAGAADAANKTGGVGAASGIDSGVEGADSVAGTAAVTGAERAGGAGATERIAQALASGAIDPVEAKAQLIDEIVRAQVPAGTDPATIEALRDEIADLLADDPVLDSLLRP